MSPAVLLGRVLAPLMEKQYWVQGGARPGTRGSALGSSFSTHAKAINGTGVIARDWVRVLETLTMCKDLKFLTMLPWADAFPLRGLFRPTRAWCPSCYEEWRENHQTVYEPLIWTLRDVEVCTRHLRYLKSKCQQCGNVLPWLSRCAIPGDCSKCGNWLGLDSENRFIEIVPDESALSWQTWVVENLEEMIASAPYLQSPSREKIAEGISRCIDQLTEGTMNKFSGLIEKRKNTVWGWQHGKTRIPMNDLLRICHFVKISLVDFLHTDFVVSQKTKWIPAIPPISGVTTRRYPPRRFDREEVERLLCSALKESPPVSMKAVASRVNTDKRFLYKHFPDLCKAISAQHATHQKACLEQIRRQREKDKNQVADKLQAEGIYPSRRRVALVTRSVESQRQSGRNLPAPIALRVRAN